MINTSMHYTEEFLLNELYKYYVKYGHAPPARKFYIAANTYRRRFGSWRIALQKAKVPFNAPKQSIKICKSCNVKFTHLSKDERKFCSSSCAAIYNNNKRTHTLKTKRKISQTLKQPYTKIGRKRLNPRIDSSYLFKKKISGDFSPLYICTCKHCSTKFVSKAQISYCKKHVNLYGEDNYNRYRFNFALAKYPDLFGHMLEQLRTIGMRSNDNVYGMTRDHKLSVNEAIRNNYDPYYIKHPLNCELMPWIDNIKKYNKSSLTYSELKLMVDSYENSI